ncbi:MAG: flagellar protein FlaG [Planctomycetota bacterium]
MDDTTARLRGASEVARENPLLRRTRGQELASSETRAANRADAARSAEAAATAARGAEADESARQKKAPPTHTELESIAKNLNRVFQNTHGIRFEIAADSGDLIVQIVDRESDEVVRTIPPERLESLARNLDELTGLLLDNRA